MIPPKPPSQPSPTNTGARPLGGSSTVSLFSPRPNASPRRRPPAPPTPSDRLWHALSRPQHRPMPAKGLDVLGEHLTGIVARARLSRRDLAARAATVLTLAQPLRNVSESALDNRIDEARDAVRLARHDPRSVHLAFAVAYEALRRVTGLSLHPEQVMGAIALSLGYCAEMATGEGKTLTAVLPASLDAFLGRGVHVITVNDYLAQRDADITTPIYHRLGLTVAALRDDTPPEQRRAAYNADITYAADKQVIFDDLRDRLIAPLSPTLTEHLLQEISATPPSAARSFNTTDASASARSDASSHRSDWAHRLVQRGLFSAIIDEADSVLVDEAVTPAIIASRPDTDSPWAGEQHFRIAADIARQLVPGEHYTVHQRFNRVEINASGRDALSTLAADLSPFWSGPRRREELVNQALAAKELYHRDDHYIIRDDKIVIVDRSTGRVLEGRQWQLGLHQAVEAKESLPITGARSTSSRTSYQRFFQQYTRLAGMTGTAWETRRELWQDYRLPVVRIPTHKPVIRCQLPDTLIRTKQHKLERVAEEVARLHARHQPVLVGTRSVADSETLGSLLHSRGISCKVLNATREAEEASIIAQAGKPDAVTVATNMAGRGTDIILDPHSRSLGGLVVISTERHDERRVDRQLFGRAGRQGDPGLAMAFIALDDPLIQRAAPLPLLFLTRILHPVLPPALRRPLAALLIAAAQHAAGKRAVVHRRQAVRHEAWMDLALHSETR